MQTASLPRRSASSSRAARPRARCNSTPIPTLTPTPISTPTPTLYDAELRAFGATDPGGGLPLPADEASHPYGSPGFIGLPRRLCALQGEVLRTDGTTITLVAQKMVKLVDRSVLEFGSIKRFVSFM